MIDFYSRAGQVIRRWPTGQARTWVTSFLQEAAQSKDVIAVIALGSAVRPDVPSEDVDLLVLHTGGARLKWRAPIEVDLRGYDMSKLEHDLGLGADLATWGIMYGVALYDEDGVWERIVDRWRGRLRLPDPDVAEKRAAKALSQLRVLEEAGDDAAANELMVSYLTHLARAALSRAGVFPASRPELVDQLRSIHQGDLADSLEAALMARLRLASETTAV